MTIQKYLIFLLAFIFAAASQAQEAKGTWKYERSSEFFGQLKSIKPPKFTTIEVTDGAARMQGCIAKVKREEFFYSDAFQPLLKQGVEQPKVDSYLQKTFQFPLAATKEVHTVTSSPENCHLPIMEFFIAGDKLLVPIGGAIFHFYVRSGASQPTASNGAVTVGAIKTSALPFNGDNYISACAPKIVDKKGIPHTTDKCAPAFFPYAADAKNSDPIMKIIGNHNFGKGGAGFADQFSTPFGHGMHPVFLLFPPTKDVMLARVDDFDMGPDPESRDHMAAVYVSIKNGKIVGQIGADCDLDAAYVCTDRDGNKVQLSDSGSFQKIK